VKVLVVLTLDVANPEDLPAILEHIAPSMIPAFKGPLRVAIDPIATSVEEYLDAE
jgi:hypothetical protein